MLVRSFTRTSGKASRIIGTVLLVLLALLMMLLFYVQLIAISQLVLALLACVLQSRRFRDLSVIVIALFSSCCYLIQQLVFRCIGSSNFLHALQSGAFSAYLQW